MSDALLCIAVYYILNLLDVVLVRHNIALHVCRLSS